MVPSQPGGPKEIIEPSESSLHNIPSAQITENRCAVAVVYVVVKIGNIGGLIKYQSIEVDAHVPQPQVAAGPQAYPLLLACKD
jgi:hypothetical protein